MVEEELLAYVEVRIKMEFGIFSFVCVFVLLAAYHCRTGMALVFYVLQFSTTPDSTSEANGSIPFYKLTKEANNNNYNNYNYNNNNYNNNYNNYNNYYKCN